MPVYVPRDTRSGKSQQVDRSPSTVARELRRNRSRTEGYKPVEQPRARRWSGSKLDDEALREYASHA